MRHYEIQFLGFDGKPWAGMARVPVVIRPLHFPVLSVDAFAFATSEAVKRPPCLALIFVDGDLQLATQSGGITFSDNCSFEGAPVEIRPSEIRVLNASQWEVFTCHRLDAFLDQSESCRYG